MLAHEAGFMNIIGIELFDEHIEFCQSRFRMGKDLNKMVKTDIGKSRIHLVKGDSALCLWDTIKDIRTTITFFLDSHSQLFEDEPLMDNPFPLLDELRQIAKHPVKTHTIIIDDFLYLTHPDITGWGKDLIETILLGTNPGYKLDYVANPVKNNILIAHI